MKYVIPQAGEVELSTIILDLNGTLTVGGKIAAGVHTQTLLTSYIVVPSINDALDLLIESDRLIATLRK